MHKNILTYVISFYLHFSLFHILGLELYYKETDEQQGAEFRSIKRYLKQKKTIFA